MAGIFGFCDFSAFWLLAGLGGGLSSPSSSALQRFGISAQGRYDM